MKVIKSDPGDTPLRKRQETLQRRNLGGQMFESVAACDLGENVHYQVMARGKGNSSD